jgi:hypothetical protein
MSENLFLLHVSATDETKMDMAFYGILHTIKLAEHMDNYPHWKEACAVIAHRVGEMTGPGKIVDIEMYRDENLLCAEARIFSTEDGRKRWKADKQLREVEKRAKTQRW